MRWVGWARHNITWTLEKGFAYNQLSHRAQNSLHMGVDRNKLQTHCWVKILSCRKTWYDITCMFLREVKPKQIFLEAPVKALEQLRDLHFCMHAQLPGLLQAGLFHSAGICPLCSLWNGLSLFFLPMKS